MLTHLKIITPTSEHCTELSKLLIESITSNCAKDYNNDPEIMREWLGNKTPENICEWVSSPNNISKVAVDTKENKLVGFALMNKDGEILLNYVLPTYLNKGVGKFLLKELVSVAKSTGIKTLSVVSTITAKSFYERNGFIKNGEPEYVGAILGDFPLIRPRL